MTDETRSEHDAEGFPYSIAAFRRIFTAIDPKGSNACFITFTQELLGELPEQCIVIDDKAVRHSFDRATEAKHLHLLSAFTYDQGLTLIGKDHLPRRVSKKKNGLPLLHLVPFSFVFFFKLCRKN